MGLSASAGRWFTDVSNAIESLGQLIHYPNIEARSIITEETWHRLDLLDVLHAINRSIHLILFPNIGGTSTALAHMVQKENGEGQLLQVPRRREGYNAGMERELKDGQVKLKSY